MPLDLVCRIYYNKYNIPPQEAMHLKLIAYIRVSTTEQVNGYGLDVQETSIKAWAKAHGHQILQTCVDGGVSGTTEVDERPGLSEAISLLMPPPAASGLVVAKLDRLARSLTVQETVLQTIWNSGGTVFTVDGPEGGEVMRDDPDDPMRTFVRQIIGGVAQLERSLIAKRMRDGRKAKASAGGFAYGAPPFGTRAEGRQLVEDPDEASTLTRILELRNGGASLRLIASALEAEGRLTKRGGTRWHPPVIAQILRRADEAA